MLKEITVKNFALIDDIRIDFDEGFNVIMGETGSGKSNLIDSISILMGDRATKDKIRSGKDSAFISCAFEISNNEKVKNFLIDNNLNSDEELLIVTREINRTSSTVSRVNNIILPVSLLKELSKMLIDIYGQFENITILSRSEQRNFIDNLGDSNHINNLNTYEDKFNRYNELLKVLDDFIKLPEEVNRDLEFLQYQINDVETSDVLSIDEEELDEKLDLIENAQSLKDGVNSILYLLDQDNDSVISNLGRIVNSSEKVSGVDKNFSEVLNRLSSSLIELEDVKNEIYNYYESLEYDEEEYKELDKKRLILFEAKRKYGNSVELIREYYENALNKIDEIHNYEENLKNKKLEISKLKNELLELSDIISKERKIISLKFTEQLKLELEQLEMFNVNFKVLFKDVDLNSKGKDELVFMISFNPNESLKELSAVASGGEISRFMLAIKSIEAEAENTPTIIFDEIDTGISGNAGNVVGNKLKTLSNKHQLISISHLPQIISKGNTQFLVYKESIDNKTVSNVKKLSYNERIIELSRVIEGDNYSEHTMMTAKKMIDDNLRGVK